MVQSIQPSPPQPGSGPGHQASMSVHTPFVNQVPLSASGPQPLSSMSRWHSTFEKEGVEGGAQEKDQDEQDGHHIEVPDIESKCCLPELQKSRAVLLIMDEEVLPQDGLKFFAAPKVLLPSTPNTPRDDDDFAKFMRAKGHEAQQRAETIRKEHTQQRIATLKSRVQNYIQEYGENPPTDAPHLHFYLNQKKEEAEQSGSSVESIARLLQQLRNIDLAPFIEKSQVDK